MKRRAVSSTARSNELIQHRAGIELPASGTWTIGSGQPILAERRRPLRTEEIALRTARGALVVAADMETVTLELDLLASDGDEPLMIGFAGCLTSADRLGRWRFSGTTKVNGSTGECELELGYQGVHARGAAPLAWLTIAEAFLADGRSRRGRRSKRRGLQITGDLNAHLASGRQSGVPVREPASCHVQPLIEAARKSA